MKSLYAGIWTHLSTMSETKYTQIKNTLQFLGYAKRISMQVLFMTLFVKALFMRDWEEIYSIHPLLQRKHIYIKTSYKCK